MLGVFHDLLPPSGAEFAVFLNLGDSSILAGVGEYIVSLAVARGNFLRLYEIRGPPETTENPTNGKKKSSKAYTPPSPRLFLQRQHVLHGIITGLASVQTLASETDHRDRLLVSFKDAKLALLEWSDMLYDISTVSIHSYERSPLLLNSDFANTTAQLRTDPGHRCAALCAPGDVMAILPWYQTQAELEFAESSQSAARELPYSPSFVLSYAEIDEHIRNVVDVVFLPGFNTPTIAVLFQPQQTWTGRLKEIKDNTRLFIVSLDVVAKSYQVIMTVENLPYDALYLTPCSSRIGGVLVVSASSIIHVSQASKTTAIPVSGWAARITDTLFSAHDQSNDLRLEGSRVALINDTTFLLALHTGAIHTITLEHEGRLVRQLHLSPAIGMSSPPSNLIVHGSVAFIGSTADESILMKLSSKIAKRSARIGGGDDAQMELELYGDESASPLVEKSLQENDALDPMLQAIDSIEDPGLTTGSTFCLDNETEEPLLITTSGLHDLGGFTLIRKSLPTRSKKKMSAIAGRKGIWSMRLEGNSWSSSNQSGDDNCIFSTDATPVPFSRAAGKSQARLDVNIRSRWGAVTIACAPFFDRKYVLQVRTNALVLLSPEHQDENEKYVLEDKDGAKIRSASISDPYVLILREDGTLGLFVGEPSRGKIRRKDMSPFGDKKACYSAALFFEDHYKRLFVNQDRAGHASAEEPSQWLLLCRPSGQIEIWTLPKLSLVYSSEYIGGPLVMPDSMAPFQPPSVEEQDPTGPETLDEVLLVDVGERFPIPHLFMRFKSGLILVYQASPKATPSASESRQTLNIQFVKIFTQKLESTPAEEMVTTVPLLAPATRALAPFSTTDLSGEQLHGVFLTGDRPRWFVKKDKSELISLPCDHNVVYAFTACSMWDSKAAFLMNTDEGTSLVEWSRDLSFHGQFAFQRIRKGRTYTNVAFDATSGLIVAASIMGRDFVLYDDEGASVWERDAPNVSFPSLPAASLELIDPHNWATIDGFEFATNETVNAAEMVRLETLSTPSGSKEFIAVGTSIHRGEDLAVRGATYIYEIAEVVRDTEARGRRQHKLKLLCREDSKGPVTAVCGVNGYLVSSMGQKLFVRAFDLDERLVGVAFLDAGVYITALRCLKNLLLIADAVKSVWFVAFQEDPFKLIVLSRDTRSLSLVAADFFFSGNDLELASLDTKGVLRLHVYDPTHVATEEGARLLCAKEFQTHGDLVSVIRVAKRHGSLLAPADGSKLVFVYGNGSVSTLQPLDPEAYRRLYLLQGQLMRNTQHFAGLNPRAHRAILGNPYGRTLLKGILDGGLLLNFKNIPFDKQNETIALIGESRETIYDACAQLEDEKWQT